jgi:NADPH:quinone reductase
MVRAVVAERFGGPEVLRLVDVEDPEPGPSQVRVVVQAAAMNPVDVVTRSGVLHKAGLHGAPPVWFGWDVFGRVDAAGAGVHRLRVGQAVIGLSDRLAARGKTHAETVVLDQHAVAAAPVDLDPGVGASLPLAGSTALQALAQLDLSPRQSILITGAAGAVGSLAVQLARLSGLRVLAAARPADRARLLALGADDVVATTPAIADDVRKIIAGGVDGSLDAAALGNASLDAVRTGGAHVSLVVLERPAPLRAIRSESIAVAARWEQLTLLGSLAATGAVSVDIAADLRLQDVREAHELFTKGGLRGRVVLVA